MVLEISGCEIGVIFFIDKFNDLFFKFLLFVFVIFNFVGFIILLFREERVYREILSSYME